MDHSKLMVEDDAGNVFAHTMARKRQGQEAGAKGKGQVKVAVLKYKVSFEECCRISTGCAREIIRRQ